MKNDLTCEVVKDLLPSYLDGLTSETANHAVDVHLEKCQGCQDTLNRMRESYDYSASNQSQDIDFLKKAREKARMRIFIGVIAAIVTVIGFVWINAFFIGKRVDNSELIQAEVTVTNKHIVITGNLTDSGKGVSCMKFENEDGVVKVSVFETLKSSFHTNDFYAGYDSEKVISQIWIENRIVWDNGDSIDAETARLYETRHPYVGDMPANGRSATALGIWKDIGNFSNELQTKEEPYGWTLIGEQEYAKESQDKIETQMQAYGSALIAVIGNLGYMTFEYTVDGVPCTLTVTEAEADALAGQSVKAMAKTPYGLQQLMKILNLSKGYLGSKFESYVQNNDGTWMCGGITYKYRVVLTGRDLNAKKDGRFVVLTNEEDITYDEVSKSMLSSNSHAWLDPEKSVIVGIGGN